jgi:allophanate hydrolase
MHESARLSVRGIVSEVSAGRLSAERSALEALERAADYDRIQPQAWIHRSSRQTVLARARSVDARLAAGERLPLAGVPFAVKDNIDVADEETTAACPAFTYVPTRSATVIERLTAAGAVPIGKSNLDQFATGLVGTRSPYGAPACVFNREYVSGGSSSGSAVLTAAGVVPLALGTDTAGSGRVPAAFNHLTGFKPTRGRWSTRGVVPACRTLDCVSAFTTDATDAALVDAVLAAFDAEDPYSRKAPSQSAESAWPVRIAVPLAHQRQFLGDGESAALYEAACERLRVEGAELLELDVAPLLESAQLLYSGAWVAERSHAMARLLETNPAAVHPVVRAIVQSARGISAADAFRDFHTLKGFARTAEAIWERADVLLLPTAPTIYRISEVLAEPVGLNSLLGLYTNFVNLLDLAAVALPAGFRRNRTGFGVSLVAPAWRDHALLELARRLQCAAPPVDVPPLDAGMSRATVELAVVGAHLSGMPLNWQLSSRGARLARCTRTAPLYRLYAMANQSPPKPALVQSGAPGHAITVEVYELELAAFGSFVAEVPAPLAIGTVTLEDGSIVRGFVAEPRALTGAEDISAFGGWRAYVERERRS